MIIAFTGSVGLLALWVGSPRGTAIWIHDINGALTEDFGRFSGIFYRVAGNIRPSIDLTPVNGKNASTLFSTSLRGISALVV
jgi:hypothetical protein